MNSTDLRSKFSAAHARFEQLAAHLQSPILLGMRLYCGWQLFGTGKGKLANLDKTAEFFAGLHIPLPTANAALAGATEMIGGLFLLVGLASRLTSLPLIVLLTVAYLTADLEAVQNIWSDPDKFIAATPFLFLLVALVVLAFGPGKFSVDHWLRNKFASAAITTPHPSA